MVLEVIVERYIVGSLKLKPIYMILFLLKDLR